MMSPVISDGSDLAVGPAISLQRALNAALLGAWHCDPLRRVFSWDARCREIFGVRGSGATVDEFMNWVHPEDVERVWAAYYKALDPAEPKRFSTQFRLRRGEGEVRWVETFGLAYFEGDGRARRAVSVVGTVADITERKQSEEQVQLLMREVNHRSKNMLTVVDAMARLTVASSPQDFVERFSERIQALSANQDLLVRNEWRTIDIEELVRAQLARFTDLIDSRIVVHGPKLRLNLATVQAIGLALHELSSNAERYGALSVDAGHVDISWRTEGNTLTLRWTEREGPPVSPPKQRGFGSTFMGTVVEQTVNGTVDIDYAASGVTWCLTCPVANALEPVEQRSSCGGKEIPTDGRE